MIRSKKIRQKNKYTKKARISEEKTREILRCFSLDLTATAAAKLVGVNRNTANKVFSAMRHRIAYINSEKCSTYGEFEVDESYFGAKRVRGKRGRGAAGKTPVFGLLKRDGNVYVEIVKNCSKDALMPIIQQKVLEGSTVYSDGWKAYDGLILNGYDHYRIHHSANEFARGKNHVNGIEAFWSFAKRRLAKFNGHSDKTFYLHLKECEFRFNNRNKSIFSIVLELARKNSF